MILERYKTLKKIADTEYGNIVEDSEIIFSYTGRARKLRLALIDMTFIDIWYSVDGDYSFHWEQRDVRESVYRHDNAPHKKWSNISTYPKHCHDGSQENVTESYLSPLPEQALREFLALVRRKLIEMGRKK
jgi:hypothetical protein